MRIIAGIKIVANGAKGDKRELVSLCQGQVSGRGQQAVNGRLGPYSNASRKEIRMILQQPRLLFAQWHRSNKRMR